MSLSDESKLVAFDAEAAVESARDVAGDSLLTAVEYTDDEWNALYVAESVRAMYDDAEHMAAHFDRIQDHKHVDSQERSLFESRLNAGDVRYFVTQMEHAAMIRLAGDDGTGLWVTVESDASAVEVAERMSAVATE